MEVRGFCVAGLALVAAMANALQTPSALDIFDFATGLLVACAIGCRFLERRY